MPVAESNRATPVTAAVAVLDQCAAFLSGIDQPAFTRPSPVMHGATIGQHLRHSLDHFAAAATALDGAVIDYDHRERDTPVERDVAHAAAEIRRVRSRLAAMNEPEQAGRVRVRVMLTGDGQEAELDSSLARELAFAAHHAVHHNAMMAAIARDFGLRIPDGFGKAPSTIQHERTRAAGR